MSEIEQLKMLLSEARTKAEFWRDACDGHALTAIGANLTLPWEEGEERPFRIATRLAARRK